jgi:hypothetical protein
MATFTLHLITFWCFYFFTRRRNVSVDIKIPDARCPRCAMQSVV